MKVAVSACLLGSKCRYDGDSRPCEAVIALARRHEVVPICPEQLGGLAIPHAPSEVDASSALVRVVDSNGQDRTDAFVKGAQRALEIAQKHDCHIAILKSKSPSCGCGAIYDGTFSKHLVSGYGIAARLLRENGIRAINENAFQSCTDAVLAGCAAEEPELETERLVLRPLSEADAEEVLAYSKDPEVGQSAGWAPHRSVEDSLSFIRTIGADPHTFAICEKESGRVAGSIGLKKDITRQNPDCLEMGYALGKQWWGRGFATEAAREMLRYGFCDLGLGMVTICHYPFNERSRHVIEKCGFIKEGIRRASDLGPSGEPRDTVCYSLTREEYLRNTAE